MRAVLVAGLLFATVAQAQDDTLAREEARRLLREGNAMYERRDYAGALDRYRAAHAKVQSPKILLNIGTTLRHLGRGGEAAEAYELYLLQNRPEVTADKRAQVRVALREIDQKLGKVRVEVTAEGGALEGAVVRVDGEVRGLSPLDRPVRVDPGLHRAEGQREGYESDLQDIDVSAGEERLLVLRLKEILPPPPEPVPVVPPPDPIVAAPPVQPPPADPPPMVMYEPAIIESEAPPEDYSHAWRLSLAAREDVVLQTEPLAAWTGVGVNFGIGDYVELAVWGLRGRRFGGRATVSLYALPHGRLKPMLVLGMTGLEVDAKKFMSDEEYGVEPLFHVGGGLLADLTTRVGLVLEVSYERYLVSLENPLIDDHLILAALGIRASLWD